jgi:hypothetical protein
MISGSRAVLASAIVYAGATAVMASNVLAQMSTAIVADLGDPVLSASILAWNAQHIPWTDAWFNFPAFDPAADVLTFSEQMLGVSVISSPLYWVTGNAALAYNATLLATYVLCGLAMYALVWRLTRSAPASFIAGLAFAFAPYRASQLSHIVVLASFWAPLALLGLHAYLDTGRRRWLVLFGLCWMLQGAANGYYLVFFSVLVGFWVLWFVVAQRRWRDAAAIMATMLLAALPLVPILARFVTAHAHYGFSRPPEEIASYGADLGAVLCASIHLVAWDWLDVVCRPEGQLFPGVALLVVCGAGGMAALGTRSPVPWPPHRRWLRLASGVLAAAGGVLVASGVSVAAVGPWHWPLGPFEITSSSVSKPVSRGLGLLVAALLLSPGLWRAARRASLPVFYGVAAVAMWILSWGPAPVLRGQPALIEGPYAWLMLLPGVDGLRVPARFWMMTVLCLSVLAGLAIAALVQSRRPQTSRLIVLAAALPLMADGWSRIPAATLLPPPPNADVIRGGLAMTLPLGEHRDIDNASQFRAVSGGWSTVNGFSGYEPLHYGRLREASAKADPFLFAPFLRRGDLHVVIAENAHALLELVNRQEGTRLIATSPGMRQYRIPRQRHASRLAGGAKLPIAEVSASCATGLLRFVNDGDPATRWQCGPQMPGQTLTADLGRVVQIGTVVPGLGVFWTDQPRHLLMETSVDGSRWELAWDGDVRVEEIEAEMRWPQNIRLTLPFSPRAARYVRLRQMGRDDAFYWSIAELELWSESSEQ